MKEIKFRAWDKENSAMYLPESLCRLHFSDGIPYCFHTWSGEIVIHKGFILMQYIGHNDEDNKEIYDGDIVHVFVTSSPLIKVVEWVNNKEFCINPGFVLANGDGGKSGFMPFSQHRIRIIGNKFEHPELIIKIKAMKEKSEVFSYLD